MKEFTEVEKPYPTVSDGFDEGEAPPVLQVRAGEIWSDFIRSSPDKHETGEAPRHYEGTVPLFDDMTGIRQWE